MHVWMYVGRQAWVCLSINQAWVSMYKCSQACYNICMCLHVYMETHPLYILYISTDVCMRPEQWMCSAVAFSLSLKHGLFKTILLLKLSYQLDAFSPRQPEQWMHRAKTFPGLPRNSLFKTILPLKFSYWLKFCLMYVLNNECGEQRTPQYHWGMAFSRPSSNWNYHINTKHSPEGPEQWKWRAKNDKWHLQDHLPSKTINSKLRLSGDLKECQESSPESLMNGLFKTIFPITLSYQLKAVSQETLTMNMQS